MKISGIIFDLDGTLLNTLDDLADSMNSVLASHGFPQYSSDAYRYFVGDGMDMLVRRTVPEMLGSEDTISTCMYEMKKVYASHWNCKTVPYKGIPEVLAALDKRGCALSVLSNKNHDMVLKTVQYYFNGITFREIIGAGCFKKKPDPEAAFHIASVLELDCSEILYVGDSMVDMKTAIAAGMHPAGVLWGFRDEKELRENGAEYILKEPSEIVDVFDEINGS